MRASWSLLILSVALDACGASAGGASGANDGGSTDGVSPEASPVAIDGGGPSPHDDASSPVTGGDGGATGGTASATLHFIAGSAYSMYASVGGGAAHPVQLDTGSLGLYVPASILGSSSLVSTQTCSITYVSSGNTLAGHTATATVALLGSQTTGEVAPPPTTVAMSLCAVDDPTFTGGVMGVGFGRTTPGDPTRNVLLQMAEVHAGTMHAGYALSTHPAPSVQIGLTTAGSAGFSRIQLSPDPSGSGDWVASSLRGCLALPGDPAFPSTCGPLLVDTGIAETLLWGPKDPTLGGIVPSGQTAVPAGTALQITAQAGASVLDFAFTLGTGADSPSAVDIRTASAFSINTGRALLVDFDYQLDAQGGFVGFRKAP